MIIRKFFVHSTVFFFAVFFSLSLSLQNQQAEAKEQVCFSPNGGCTQTIVDNLSQAEISVLVQAYSFTSQPIAEALVNAHKRGVKAKVLLDRSQQRGKGNKIDLLVDAGIPVSVDTKHAIAHNKVMIIDGITVITGSFNFTAAAESRNAENLLVVKNKSLAKKYRDNWSRHQKHSTPIKEMPV